MKKIVFTVISVAFATSAIAGEWDKILSVDYVTFAGTKYDLPTTEKSDGTVCVSYLSATRHEGDKSVATVAQHCERKGERGMVLPSIAFGDERG